MHWASRALTTSTIRKSSPTVSTAADHAVFGRLSVNRATEICQYENRDLLAGCQEHEHERGGGRAASWLAAERAVLCKQHSLQPARPKGCC